LGRQTRSQETVRRAREEAYRGLILAAAERIFGDKGYAEAKVQEIAEAAGVATGTVYGIFPSKRELYRAIHRETLEQLAKRYAEIPTLERAASDVMLDRVTISTRFLTERPDYLRMYLREASRWGFDASELPAGAMAFTDLELYARGVAEGDLIEEDPEVIQQLAMTAGQVFLHQWWKAGMHESPDALIARIQAHYRSALFRSR
jgi:AcrR family transcriptional regulator